MRATASAVVCIFLAGSAAFAAEPMAANDIQATLFNGQPFTASTPGGTQFTMIFKSNGTMSREPLGKSGYKGNGKWKLAANGFCTSWTRAKPSCFTVISNGSNKWSVNKGANVVATWTK